MRNVQAFKMMTECRSYVMHREQARQDGQNGVRLEIGVIAVSPGRKEVLWAVGLLWVSGWRHLASGWRDKNETGYRKATSFVLFFSLPPTAAYCHKDENPICSSGAQVINKYLCVNKSGHMYESFVEGFGSVRHV